MVDAKILTLDEYEELVAYREGYAQVCDKLESLCTAVLQAFDVVEGDSKIRLADRTAARRAYDLASEIF